MMSAMSLTELSLITGGQLQGQAHFQRLSTDTRSLQPGDLYVALTGEQFDGHQFLPQAIEAGACAAVVEQSTATSLPTVKVASTRQALGLIARTNRRQFTGPLVAITGSAGKTSTKEMLASILAVKGKVLATQGNLNNEIGVPLTLLDIDSSCQYAVIEMGARQRGDISYLTQFAEPTISVLTNAMPAHIEGFKNIETIASTKGEIFECLAGSGVAVINLDDRFYQQWLQQSRAGKTVSFSKADPAADYYASDLRALSDGGCRFCLHAGAESVTVHLALLGEHNVVNALAAAAAAVAAGADLQQVKQGLENVSATKGRLQTYRQGELTVIDDSYNASPGSVTAAIDVLSQFKGKRCLVLGVMGELGELAEQSHRQVAVYAKQCGIEQLIAVGEYAELVVAAFAGNGRAYSDMAQLVAERDTAINADIVLIKGSRSARMERLVDALLVNKEGSR